MRTNFLKIVLVAVPLAGLAIGVMSAQEKPGGNAAAAKMKNPAAATPESIAAGETLYRRSCRGCHGKDATGGPPKDAGLAEASNLVDDKWDHGSTDGEIFYTIRNGVAPDLVMEPWDDRLSETDTWNIVNYLRSLAKK